MNNFSVDFACDILHTIIVLLRCVKGGIFKTMDLIKDSTMLARMSIREEVYLKVQDWIITGYFKPGVHLKDKELAEALGVSRTPVREALILLEEEGFVQSKRNSWTQVSPVDIEEAYRIYPIISALECLAIEESQSKIEATDIEKMELSIGHLKSALENQDALKALKADQEFHQIYIDKCDNEELIKIIFGLKLKLRRLESFYFNDFKTAEQSVLEHTDILQAIKLKDFKKFTDAVKANWDESLMRISNQYSLRTKN